MPDDSPAIFCSTRLNCRPKLDRPQYWRVLALSAGELTGVADANGRKRARDQFHCPNEP